MYGTQSMWTSPAKEPLYSRDSIGSIDMRKGGRSLIRDKECRQYGIVEGDFGSCSQFCMVGLVRDLEGSRTYVLFFVGHD